MEHYTRVTMTRTHVSSWRSWGKRQRVTDTVPERSYEGTSAVEDRDLVWRLLGRLSKQQRAVIVLRFYEDLAEAQIEEALGISVGTVKSHLSRGLARLREELGETGASWI